MNLLKDKYSYTGEEIEELLSKIVKEYSRKKFTEDDIVRIIDNNPKKKVNRRQTGYNIFMDEYREDKQGEKQSELFKKGGKYWKELTEEEKTRYKDEAEQKKREGGEEKEDEYEEYIKYELKCKNKDKIWMYKIEDEDNKLLMYNGMIGSKMKKEEKKFLDDEQLNCYLNKQLLLKRKKGYIEK